MKISDLKENFKRYMLFERGLKPKTFKACLSSLKLLEAYSGIEDIKSFNTGIIREFLYSGMQNRGWGPKTFRNHCQSLKTFFDWCVKNGTLKKNPAVGIEKPKLKKSLPRCLTREDAMKILYYAGWLNWTYKLEKTRNEAIIHTFIFSGLRLQELLNLEVRDVNLEDESLSVRNGKGGKDRFVPIHPHLIPKLRAYYTERKKYLKPSMWFFTGIKSDKKLYPKDIRRILKEVGNASGVKVTAHMLRHTFGKLMVEADYNIYKLKEIMGHEQVTTTQRYVSISTKSIKESFDQIKLI